ncbi:MAG: cysteine hydrolase family protein [Acidimicrobiales bacterium]
MTRTEASRPPRALLLIDFQYDFLAADGRMPVDRGQVEPVVAAARIAIAQARDAGDLIIRIGNEFRTRDLIGNALRHRAALAGSSGSIWDSRVDAAGSVYLPKWKGSAFCNPELLRILKLAKVEEVYIAGLFAGACVTATARAAKAQGLSVRVLVDAIACKTDVSRSKALARLASNGVELTAIDSAS